MTWPFPRNPKPDSDIVAGVRALAKDASRWKIIGACVYHNSGVNLSHNGWVFGSAKSTCELRLPDRDREAIRLIYASLFLAICEREAATTKGQA